MSKQGRSRRERQIDAVISLIREPRFHMQKFGGVRVYQGDDRSEVPPAVYVVRETPPLPSSPDFSAAIPTNATAIFSQRFESKETAEFCRDYKNAEAIINAITGSRR